MESTGKGIRYNRLTTIKPVVINKKGRNHQAYLCRCDCGNRVTVFASNLKSSHTKSCGCLRRDMGRERIKEFGKPNRVGSEPTDLKGGIHHRWRVLEYAGSRHRPCGSSHAYWKCRCQCGAIQLVAAQSLLSGRSKSCGCLRDDLLTAKRLANGIPAARAKSKSTTSD